MRDLKMTPEVRQKILDWDKARRELGTQSDIAARLGISPRYVEKILADERYREHRTVGVFAKDHA